VPLPEEVATFFPANRREQPGSSKLRRFELETAVRQGEGALSVGNGKTTGVPPDQAA